MRLAAALLLLLTGCVSFSTLQRADVLEEGKTRVGIAPIELRGESSDAGVIPAMPLVATVRHGIGYDMELGGRFWLIGASFGAKYQFLRTTHLAASVSPEVLLFSLGSNRAGIDVVLPLLAGVALGEHQLLLGARVVSRQRQLASNSDRWGNQLFPGAVLGVDFAMGHGVHVLPEVNVSYWPGGHETFWTSTLGFYFDTDRYWARD